jgi:hypothetical protein
MFTTAATTQPSARRASFLSIRRGVIRSHLKPSCGAIVNRCCPSRSPPGSAQVISAQAFDASHLGVMGGEIIGDVPDGTRPSSGEGFGTQAFNLARLGISPAEQALQRRLHLFRASFSSWTALPLPPCKCLKVQPDGFPDKHGPGLCREARLRRTSVHRPSMDPSVDPCWPSARWFGQKADRDNRFSATAAMQILMSLV